MNFIGRALRTSAQIGRIRSLPSIPNTTKVTPTTALRNGPTPTPTPTISTTTTTILRSMMFHTTSTSAYASKKKKKAPTGPWKPSNNDLASLGESIEGYKKEKKEEIKKKRHELKYGPDSAAYLAKKKYFASMLQAYGRQVVLDILKNPSVEVVHLHVDREQKKQGIIPEIIREAEKRKVKTHMVDNDTVARISRNVNLAQGVVVDIKADNVIRFDFADFKEDYINSNSSNEPLPTDKELMQTYVSQIINRINYGQSDKPIIFLALDGVTTPQNVGMVLRNLAATTSRVPKPKQQQQDGADAEEEAVMFGGVIISNKACPYPGHPLVLRASAGTAFKTNIIMCEDLAECINALVQYGGGESNNANNKDNNFRVLLMDASAQRDIFDENSLLINANTSGSGNNNNNNKNNDGENRVIYLLGSEGYGVSEELRNKIKAHIEPVKIPMSPDVESLNVAVSAALVCYRHYLLSRNQQLLQRLRRRQQQQQQQERH